MGHEWGNKRGSLRCDAVDLNLLRTDCNCLGNFCSLEIIMQ